MSKHFSLFFVRTTFTFLVVLLTIFPAIISAKAGDLDLTFGSGTGKVLLTASSSMEHEYASTLQRDGKILVAGICRLLPNGSAEQTCIARFLTNGVIDSAFGTEGFFRSQAGNCVGGGAIATSPTGEIYYGGVSREIVSGAVRNRFCVSRLLPSGAFDVSFGAAGVASVYVDGTDYLYNSSLSLSVLQGGRLFIAGTCSLPFPNRGERRFCAARMLANGDADIAFGSNGSLIVLAGTPFDFLSTVAESGTSMFLIGFCSYRSTPPLNESICVSKINFDGAVDSSWSAQGRFSANLPDYVASQGSALIAAADGSITIAAACIDSTNRHGCVLRLRSDGFVDSTFASNGLLLDWSSYQTSGFGSIAQADKYIILGGRCGASLNANSPCTWRMTTDGTPDASFGMSGVVQVPFPSTTKSFSRYGVTQQVNGKILMVMTCVYANGDEDFCLARLLDKDGAFDLDSDGSVSANTDGILYLRHLLGFQDSALTSGVLGAFADRTLSSEITAYLSSPNPAYPYCSKNIVGAPGGPLAFADGLVLLRVMLGLTGNTVTSGINFPAGTTRTNWPDIMTYLVGNCGMVLN